MDTDGMSLKRPPGAPKRLIVLVQFDADGTLPPHVKLHLERIRSNAARLILVSNSPVDAQGLETAEAICDKVILRNNIGWDFAAWRDALAQEDMDAWDEVILTNSSVIGPLFDIEPILIEMAQRPADFWGMVHSMHKGPHLQSYFLAFKPQVTRSEAWASFCTGVEDISDKDEVIGQYEVGLTPCLRNAGFTADSYIPSPRFPASIRWLYSKYLGGVIVPWNVNYVNRTVRQYYTLIDEGMPYLKASLLWGKDINRFHHGEALLARKDIDFPWEDVGLTSKL